MTQPPCIQPSVVFSLDSCSSLSMVSRLRAAFFRFAYTFDSGHRLVGLVEGDRFNDSSSLVFNLRALRATCLDASDNALLKFDTAFGQFNVTEPEVVFIGSHAAHSSFFTFNHRGGEASIYNAVTDTWVTSGWNPSMWTVEKFTWESNTSTTQGNALWLNWANWLSA